MLIEDANRSINKSDSSVVKITIIVSRKVHMSLNKTI